MDENNNYEVFETLIRRTNKVLFSYDVEAASFSYLNGAFSHIWQRTLESAMESPALLLEAIHPDDSAFLLKEYEELLKGIIKAETEFRIVLPDRSVKWLLLNAQLITDALGKHYIAGLLEDITVTKNNFKTVERFAAKKDSVLEILSHELAGPIGNIQSLAGLLSESTEGYNNPDVNKIIKIIHDSSTRSIQLIRDFVQQEFLESAQAGLMRKRVDMVEKLHELIGQYQEGEDLIQKEISFSASADKIYAFIDENKFMQVINNLLSNAIKFTRNNGTIAVELVEQDSSVLVTVKDNGVGIPSIYHNELFEKFTKARREGLRGEPSTGLGMSTIKTIVEWHNGKVWFESEENVGSTFYIELPLK